MVQENFYNELYSESVAKKKLKEMNYVKENYTMMKKKKIGI